VEALTAIVIKRHIWQEPWNNPRYSTTIAPGGTAIMTDIQVKGAFGVLTDLGVLWVPAGPNNDLFYYNWIVDGELREKILRVIGTGSVSDIPLTGVPFPQHFEPPMTFNRRMQIICYNNDTVPHVGEVYAGGYTLRRRPDLPGGLGF
jgi:hypothetical protein